MFVRILPLVLLLGLAACGDGGAAAGNNHVSEEPFGATGAPGADMTDNGATDGADGNYQGNGS